MEQIKILYPPNDSKLAGLSGIIIGSAFSTTTRREIAIPKNDPPIIDIFKDGNHISRKLHKTSGNYNFFTGLFQYAISIPEEGEYTIVAKNNTLKEDSINICILTEEQILNSKYEKEKEFNDDHNIKINWEWCDIIRGGEALISFEASGFKTGYFLIINIFNNGVLSQSIPINWSRHNTKINQIINIPKQGEIAIGCWIFDTELKRLICIDYKTNLIY